MSGLSSYTALSFSFVTRTIAFCSGLFLLSLPACVIGQEVTSEDGIAIYGDRIVGQQFQYPMSNLDRIGIRINKSDQPNSTDLLLTLKKSANAGQVIVEQRIPLSSMATGEVFWFEFMAVGDDEDPTYYLQIASPQSVESNTPLLQTTYIGDAATIGPALVNGQEQEQSLQIVLQYDRSLWTRIEYVLARFEIDKPWFYNRYVYAIMFVGYLILLAGFLVYTYKIIVSSDEARASGKFNTFLYLTVFIFLVRGVLYSSIFPAWQAPDEPAHFAYIKYLVEQNEHPPYDAVIQKDILESMEKADYGLIYRGGRPRLDRQTWIVDPRDEILRDKRAWQTIAGLPYLYHVIVSIPYRWIRDKDTTTQLFLLRLLMVMFSSGLIILTFKTGRLVYPDDSTSLIVSAILCFYPLFLHISTIVSYDVLANLFSGLFIFMLVQTHHKDNPWFYVTASGLALGAALLTKGTTLMLLPGVIIWWVLGGLKNESWRDISSKALVLYVIAFCVGGWWYAKNIWLHQTLVYQPHPDWEQVGEVNAGLGLSTIESLGWAIQYSWFEEYWMALRNTFYRLSNGFAWNNVPMKSWMHIFSGVVFLAAAVGAVKRLKEIVGLSMSALLKNHSTQILFYSICIVYSLLLFFDHGHSVMGRYYFPVLIPGVYLFVTGMLNLFPVARKPLFSWGLIVVFIIFDSLVLLETIIPRYYLIPPPSRILDYIL